MENSSFVQVMKDWKRMCSAMEKLHPNDSCAGCRLEGYGCPAIYEDNSHVDYSDVEKNVTAWAAEHPEPVYPTWAQWLKKMGIIEIRWNGPVLASMRIGVDDTDYIPIVKKMLNPIPADIAEKLGIEPKEM